MKFKILSTKRSTHHAFIESFLVNNSHVYENNMLENTKGEFIPSVVVKKDSENPYVIVKSFEMRYEPEKIEKLFSDYTSIFYLRDPINTLASLFSVKIKKNLDEKTIYDGMEQYQKLLSYCIANSINFVYANDFWSNEKYRFELSKKFELSFTLTETISTFAAGGRTYFGDTKITYDRLLCRALDYSSNVNFIETLVNYSEIIEYFLEHKKDNRVFDLYKSLLPK